MNTTRHRDTIVVGASMGGVEALSALVSQLPADLPARMLVVQHMSEQSPGLLGEILSAAGPLPAGAAVDGAAAEPGRIYIAPPGHHLLLAADGLRVRFGPRENRARPAIDPLFRTAAVHCRSRVIGVVLTGLLGDGAAGLLAVHRCGGAAVVQAPEYAAHPEMPQRALAAVPHARRMRLDSMGALLRALVAEPAPPPPPVPDALRLEAQLTERTMSTDDWADVPSRATDFTCPECSGALREIEDPPLRYRCRVGHAYSAADLVDASRQGTEDALWIALQTLQERAQLLEKMAAEDRRNGRSRIAGGFEERAVEARTAAERLRQLLGDLDR